MYIKLTITKTVFLLLCCQQTGLIFLSNFAVDVRPCHQGLIAESLVGPGDSEDGEINDNVSVDSIEMVVDNRKGKLDEIKFWTIYKKNSKSNNKVNQEKGSILRKSSITRESHWIYLGGKYINPVN